MVTMHVNGRVFKVNKNLTSKEMLNTYAQRFKIDLPSYTMNQNDNCPDRKFTARLQFDGKEVVASGPSKKSAKAEAASNFINNIFHRRGSSPIYGNQVSPGSKCNVTPKKKMKNMIKMTEYNADFEEKAYKAGDYGVYNDLSVNGFDVNLSWWFWQTVAKKASKLKRRALTKMIISVRLESINEDDEDLDEIYAPVRPAINVVDLVVEPPVAESTLQEHIARLVFTPAQVKSSVFTPAYESSTLPRQTPDHITQVILPVEDIQSPSNLSVRLVSEEAALLQLVAQTKEGKMMTEDVAGVLHGDIKKGVCFLETPDRLYVCPPSYLHKCMEILTSTQDTPAGSVNPVVGYCYLVMYDNRWCRGKIKELDDNKFTAEVILLDYGKTVKAPVSDLRQLPAGLTNTPGLVFLVSLVGVRPQGEQWSVEKITGALLMMDVAGDKHFKVAEVSVDESMTVVGMKDADVNDISGLMIETSLARQGNSDMKDDLSLVPGKLSPGQHKLLSLAAVSPMEPHLCTQEQFQYLSHTIVPRVGAVAAKAGRVVSVKKGDLVLACEDQVWYRAVVKQSPSKEKVKVELVDLALATIVHKDNLRVVNASVLKDPVVAVSCCLDSWVQEDKTVAVEDKMESIWNSILK